MEKQVSENVIQYIVYGIVILFSFIKSFSAAYQYVKDIFSSKGTKDSKGDITVNVSNIKEKEITVVSDYMNFLRLLLEQGAIMKAMTDLRSDILREQMDYFSRHMEAIKISTTDIIVSLLRDADIEDIHMGTYFNNFENFMDIVENNCTIKFRQMCRDNHFSECSQQEYRDLIARNTTIIEGLINDLFRKRYSQRLMIKNFKRMNAIKPLIKAALLDCFEQAKEIATEKEKKVLISKESFEKKVTALVGTEYKLEI